MPIATKVKTVSNTTLAVATAALFVAGGFAYAVFNINLSRPSYSTTRLFSAMQASCYNGITLRYDANGYYNFGLQGQSFLTGNGPVACLAQADWYNTAVGYCALFPRTGSKTGLNSFGTMSPCSSTTAVPSVLAPEKDSSSSSSLP